MNKNRIFALLICASLLLTSFIMPTAVFAEDVVEEESSANIDLLKTLGVFPADLMPGMPLTRNDLARIYFRILMPEQADAEYIPVENHFSDLGDEHFAANFAAQMGIMNGRGDGTFNPNGTLSYNEIVKTLVCFLGYKDIAESKGGYPFGYIMCATELGFSSLADSQNIVSTDVAAALFIIASNVDLMEVESISEEGVKYNKTQKNYLEKYLNIYLLEGIVTANYLDNIYETGKTSRFHFVNIGNTEVELTEDNLSLRNYIGYNVKAFVSKYEVTDTSLLIWYEVFDTNEYKIDSANFGGYNESTNKITYFTEKGREKSFDINGAYVIYNNSLCESYEEHIINPFLDPTLDASITLLDNNDDSEIDVVIVRAYRSYVISKIVDGKIYNKYHPSVIFDIKNFEDGDYALTNVNGATIPVSTLEEGDIISVLTDKDGNIREIIVSLDFYVGNVSEIRYDSSSASGIIVDKQYFEFASRYATEFTQSPMFDVGDKVKLFFDFNRKVCNIETEAYASVAIGYLIDMVIDTHNINDTVDIRILTNTGDMLITTLNDTLKVNETKVDAKDVFDIVGYATNGVDIKRQVIKYEYDHTKDCITSIDTVNESIDETSDGFYQYKNVPVDALKRFRTSTKSFDAKLLLASNSIVFVVPDEADRKNMESYETFDSSFFKDGTNSYTIEAYGSQAYNPVAEAVVIKLAAGATITSIRQKSTHMVISKVNQIYEDGDIKYSFTGYVSGTLYTYNCKDESLFYIAEGNTAPDVGDVVCFGLDRFNEIVTVDYLYDASEKKLGSQFTSNPTDSNLYANYRYFTADVKFFDDISMTLEIPSYLFGEDPIIEHYPASGLTIYEYDTSARTPEIKVANSSVLHDDITNNYPAKVFLYSYQARPNFIIVFHE